jgi:hypothetical protein
VDTCGDGFCDPGEECTYCLDCGVCGYALDPCDPGYKCDVNHVCTLSDTTSISTTSTTPTTSSTTVDTTTTGVTTTIVSFIVNDFYCNTMLDGYNCMIDYTNSMGEDGLVVVQFTDAETSVSATAGVTQVGQGNENTGGLLYCSSEGSGSYYVSWKIYMASDPSLSNVLLWSTSGQIKTVVC